MENYKGINLKSQETDNTTGKACQGMSFITYLTLIDAPENCIVTDPKNDFTDFWHKL